MDDPVATGKTLQELLKVVKSQRPEQATLLHDIRRAMETFDGADGEGATPSDSDIFNALANIETLADSLARGVIPPPRHIEGAVNLMAVEGVRLQVRAAGSHGGYRPLLLPETTYAALVAAIGSHFERDPGDISRCTRGDTVIADDEDTSFLEEGERIEVAWGRG